MATSRGTRPLGTNGLARVGLLLGLIAIASVVLVPLVRAPPPVPMTTQGTAFGRSGSPLPAGTPIRTFIDGVDYSNRSAVSNALGAYSILTAGDLVINGTTPEPFPIKTGAVLGERVIYAASDFTSTADAFQEVLPWFPGRTVVQDLHLGSTNSTPQPLKIQGLVAQPAPGGPGYVFLCNPTAGPASLADYYLQLDAPGTVYGGNLTLSGSLAAGVGPRQNLTTAFPLVATGDALKLVFRNPGGPSASAAGADIVVDRVEFNATVGGTLDWQPGSTIMGSAPAPGPGEILERSPSCADSNSPSDFRIAREPGLPTPLGPTARLLDPGAGQTVPGGQPLAVRWTMTDNVFASTYLRVWVNASYAGTTVSLVAGAAGPNATAWNVPGVSSASATLTLDVVDPFGLRASDARTITITEPTSPTPTPLSVYVAVLVILVIIAFVALGYRHAVRQESQRGPPAAPPTPPEGATAVPPAPGVPTPTSKRCPNCHTAVKEEDETCFFCGQPLPKGPP